MAQDFHDLIVWQKAIDLAVCIYALTQGFPKTELYGLTSQMRRSSISVASNIAEGRGRLNAAEFHQFLGLAQGSLFELRTQLLIARKLGFASCDSFSEIESSKRRSLKAFKNLYRKTDHLPTGRRVDTPATSEANS